MHHVAIAGRWQCGDELIARINADIEAGRLRNRGGDSVTEPISEGLVREDGKIVYVIDGHSLIYQLFHALPELSSPSGEPVGAVFGFARDLLYLLETKKPDYLFCAFDVGTELLRRFANGRRQFPRDEIEVASILIEARESLRVRDAGAA